MSKDIIGVKMVSIVIDLNETRWLPNQLNLVFEEEKSVIK